MKIVAVKLIPGANENKIEDLGEYLKIRITQIPEKGKANVVLIKLLAKYYKVAQNKINIIQGTRLRKKLVEIDL